MHSTHYYWDGDDGNGNVDGHDEMVVMMMWMIRMLMLKEAPVYLRANNVCVSWGFQRILASPSFHSFVLPGFGR